MTTARGKSTQAEPTQVTILKNQSIKVLLSGGPEKNRGKEVAAGQRQFYEQPRLAEQGESRRCRS
jgi:hypothetical protein